MLPSQSGALHPGFGAGEGRSQLQSLALNRSSRAERRPRLRGQAGCLPAGLGCLAGAGSRAGAGLAGPVSRFGEPHPALQSPGHAGCAGTKQVLRAWLACSATGCLGDLGQVTLPPYTSVPYPAGVTAPQQQGVRREAKG